MFEPYHRDHGAGQIEVSASNDTGNHFCLALPA
jgi:hypothetical protein